MGYHITVIIFIVGIAAFLVPIDNGQIEVVIVIVGAAAIITEDIFLHCDTNKKLFYQLKLNNTFVFTWPFGGRLRWLLATVLFVLPMIMSVIECSNMGNTLVSSSSLLISITLLSFSIWQ